MTRATATVWVAGLIAASLITTGCSSSGGEPAGGATTTGSTELTILSLGNGDDELLTKLTAEFEAANPGVTVTVSNIPEDVYVTKLQTAILADDAPDLAFVYGKGYVKSFQPLNDTLYKELPLSDYNETVLDGACGLDGQIYCMGGYIGGLVLAYNKDILTKAGLPFPSTTEPLTMTEYAALARKIKAAGTKWGGDAPTPTYWVDYGVFLDDAGKVAELTNPTYVQAVEQLASLVADKTAPGRPELEASGSEDAMKDFLFAGDAGMMILDSSSLSSGEKLPIDVGFAPVPVPDGGGLWVTSFTNALGIPVGAKNPEGAREFLALMGTSGQAMEVARGQLPLRFSDAEAYAKLGEPQAQYKEITALAKPTVFTPNLFAWSGIIDDAYYAVLRGDADVTTALTEAQPKVQEVLDTTWKAFEDSAGE